MNSLLLQAALTGATQLVLGGVVAAPPAAIPADEVSAGYVLAWDAAAHQSVAKAPAWDQATPVGADLRAAWQDTTAASAAAAGAAWQDTAPVAADAGDRWQPTATLGFGTGDAWADVYPTAAGGPDHWQPTSPLGASTRIAWDVTAAAWLVLRAGWQAASPLHHAHAQPMRDARPGWAAVRDAWQQAMPPLPGYWTGPVNPPVPVVPHPVSLRFRCLLDHTTHLVLGHTCQPVVPPRTGVIPVLEFYYVINSVSLVRADSGDAIPCRDLRVGISRDTPHWSWSASIPGAARALLARDPDPVELIATLNGQALRLVVERTQRDRRVASDWIRASGRSRSAWLSAPYAASSARGNASSANAQQLAGEALTINGIPIGWTLDWHVPDWLIPAGAWSHSGTYMEAVVRIAEAAGGYVQAHPSDQVLHVLPLYPALPWELSSSVPDVVLPEDVVEVEGVELSDSPEYNAVYVEGLAGGGRRDRILRTGSLGDAMAPQVVDALATAVEMTRARGAAVLAAGGLQERVQIRMPVLSYTGLILPGNVVDYTAEGVTRRGISRSIDVEWSSPDLWQTIEVEVHV